MADGSRSEFSIEEQLEQNTRSLGELSSCMVSFSKSFKDETTRHFDEFNGNMDLIMEMLRGLSNDIRKLISPSDYGSEFSIMNLQPDSAIGAVQQVKEQQIEESMLQIEANLHTPVEVNEAAELNPIVVEEISIQDVGGVANENAVNEGNKEDFSDEINEGHLQILQMGAEEGKVIDEMLHPNTGHYVFDNLPKSVPTARQSFYLVSLFRNERNDNSLLNKAINQMLDEVGQPFWLKMQGIKAARNMFDEMPELTSMKQNDKIDGLEELVSSIVRLPRVLGCGSEVTEVSSFPVPSKSMFEEVSKFVDVKNHELDVDFWLDGILMFIFNPGGHSSFHMSRNLFEFKHCFILFQTLYMFDKFLESHTLLDYASKPLNNCQSPSYHSKRKLRYVFNCYAASENHNGEKFDYRSSYTSSLMETSVEVVGLIVNEEVEWMQCLGFGSERHFHLDNSYSGCNTNMNQCLESLVCEGLRRFSDIEVSESINAAHNPVDEELRTNGLLNPKGEIMSKQDVGGLETGAIQMFDNFIDSIQKDEFSSLEAGIQLVEKDEQSFPSKLEVVEVAYKVFEEMPNPFLTGLQSSSLLQITAGDSSSHSSFGDKKEDEFFPEGITCFAETFMNSTDHRVVLERLTWNSGYEHVSWSCVISWSCVLMSIFQDVYCDDRVMAVEAFAQVRRENLLDSENVNHLVDLILFGHDTRKQYCCIMEDCGLNMMNIGFDRLRPKNFELGLLLNDYKHFKQYMNSNDYDGVAIAKLENFVWDPGWSVISFYILEDKDVFERVGKDIVLMDTTLVIRRYDHERQMGCLDDIGFSWEDFGAELEHYIWDPGSFRISLAARWRLFFFYHLEDKVVVEGKDMS